MRKQGFTLSELLVGVVIGLLLTTAMLSFTSTIVFDFHAQKDMVNDRTVLKQIMNGISEDMVQVGFDASADGQITLEASSEAFIEVGEEQLGYWVPTASIDVVTSDQPGLDLGWQKVSWTIENFKDPITLEEIPCLVRTIEDADKVVLSQEPVLTRVESFIPEIGLSDGTFIANLDDVTNFPKIRSVRIRLRSKTLNNTTASNPGSDELIEQESTQIYFLRSRTI